MDVETNAACEWTAVSDAAWIRLAGGATGKGNGAVTLAVDASSGATRSGTIRVAGQTVTVTQAAVSCTYKITPTIGTISAAGATATVTVSAPGHCPWTAASNVPWTTIASGGSGNWCRIRAAEHRRQSGRGPHRYGDYRGADLRADAGSRALHLQDHARHRDDIRSRRQRHGDRVGGRSLFVDGCLQRALDHDRLRWQREPVPGSVQLNIAGNPGAARTGTAIIGTQTFRLTQAAAPCTFTISPATIDVPLAGGERTTNVTTRGDCAWTAAASVPWITVTAGSSATGSGTVNSTSPRTMATRGAARITIGGQILTVRQEAAPCTFAFSTASQTYDAAGGYGAVGIATRSTCSWTAVASSIGGWLVITDRGAGTGNGVVNFSVAINAGPERTGSLSVGGQTFWVIQKAP